LGTFIRAPFPLFSVVAADVWLFVEVAYNRNNRKRAPLSPGCAAPLRDVRISEEDSVQYTAFPAFKIDPRQVPSIKASQANRKHTCLLKETHVSFY